jgi:TFIIF-interacting CTD phosphatase-like protein
MFNKYNGIIKSHTSNNLYDGLLEYKNTKLNIVLDLDNTIIYTIIYNSSNILKIKLIELFKNDNLLGKFIIDTKTYLVYMRPYLTFFLNTIKLYFNIYIYTNSQNIYCNNIINLLKKKYPYLEIKKIICRNDSLSYIKKLSLFCDNIDDLHFLNDIPIYTEFVKKTIIIDDDINIWKYDTDNLINIKPYIINKNYFNLPDNTLLIDDTLLILTNRLFLIYNFFHINYENDINFDIKNLILKYKL